MVNNFETIKDILTFENDGDCYYVQLLRRQADDPLIDGKKDPKYHGNMHSRSIKDYFIRSKEHLMDVMPDIITLCDTFNVRAYIRLNKRTYKGIALNIIKHITEQLCSGETFSSPFHMISSAAGKCCQAGDAKTWIVDLDKEYLPYEEKIKSLISQCNSFDEEKVKWVIPTNSVKWVIPTKSGKHIITRPFNTKRFHDMWLIDSELKQLPYLDVHKDNPTILYVPDFKV